MSCCGLPPATALNHPQWPQNPSGSCAILPLRFPHVLISWKLHRKKCHRPFINSVVGQAWATWDSATHNNKNTPQIHKWTNKTPLNIQHSTGQAEKSKKEEKRKKEETLGWFSKELEKKRENCAILWKINEQTSRTLITKIPDPTGMWRRKRESRLVPVWGSASWMVQCALWLGARQKEPACGVYYTDVLDDSSTGVDCLAGYHVVL